MNAALVDATLDARAITFENVTGDRGAGGTAHGGRKGAPNRRVAPGERVVLADIEGPGVVRHIWMTFPPAPPEQHAGARARGLLRRRRPSRASRCRALDFFGLPHGRPVRVPLGADRGAGGPRLQLLPADAVPRRRPRRARERRRRARPILYYQIDYTLEPELPAELGLPPRRVPAREPDDAAAGLRDRRRARGPGPVPRLQRRRPRARPVRLVRRGRGEGVPRRRRRRCPTICGTGLEDYVGSAWGMGAHARALRRRAARRDRGRGTSRSPAAATPTSSASTAGTCPTRSCSTRDLRGDDPADRRQVLPRPARRPSSRPTSRPTRSRARAG